MRIIVDERAGCHPQSMPDTDTNPYDAFRLLKESLGSLLFVWCQLEDALAEEVRMITENLPEPPGMTFGNRLTILRSLLAQAAEHGRVLPAELDELVHRIDWSRRRRNLIVHHLRGLSSDPQLGEPHIICSRSVRGKQLIEQITQTELAGLLKAISGCRRDLYRFTDFLKQAPLL